MNALKSSKGIEDKVKEYVKSLGIEVVGVAGPDQLDGPPSTDPTYVMRGAKSCVIFAVPLTVESIYDFFSKKNKTHHNIDKMKKSQVTNHTSVKIAEFLKSQGFKAKPIMANMVYRRQLNLKAKTPHPDFSLRLGAIAAGIAGQGLSGNVVTEKYGASVYLGGVVTDAVFESDPMMPPRYIMDEICSRCKICNQACAVKMFVSDKEEYVMMNNQLLPRGFRRDLAYCNTNCFGVHSVSDDHKWSSWGSHVMEDFLDGIPESDGKNIQNAFLKKVASAGDSGSRFYMLSTFVSKVWPEELFSRDKLGKEIEDYPEDELERRKVRRDDLLKYCGVKIDDPEVNTCGNCAQVCAGADIAESAKRLKMLRQSGIVVKQGDGSHAVVKTFEEAQEIRKNDPHIISTGEKFKQQLLSLKYALVNMIGFEPKGLIQHHVYKKRMKRAIEEQQPEDRMASLKADRTAAGPKVLEELRVG